MQANSTQLTPAVVVKIVVFSVIMVVIFAAIAAPITMLVDLVYGRPLFSNNVSVMVGVLCGMTVWAFVALFHLKKTTVFVKFQDKPELLGKLRPKMEELGYALESDTGRVVTFSPSFQAMLFGGGITIELEGNSAKVTGPKMYVEKVQNHFRFLRATTVK